MVKKILYSDLSTDDYTRFNLCRPSTGGEELTFEFANGTQYVVSIKYFLQWFPHPHHIIKDGRSVQWRKGINTKKHKRNVKFSKCRRIADRIAVRVYLNDKTAYDVSWEIVLMACEKNYEGFGGDTDRSKEMTFKWHKANKTKK